MEEFFVTGIFFIVLVFLVLSKFRRFFIALAYLEHRSADTHKKRANKEIRFTILVPLLDDSEHIVAFKECIKMLAGNESAEVIFVISGRSKNVENIQAIIGKTNHSMQHIVVPYEHSNSKATQINYAIERLNISSKSHYVVIYDADSLPDRDTLQAAVAVIAERNQPYILQQPSLYQSTGTLVQQMEGLFQSFWTFHYEIYYFLKNFQRSTNLTYVVGHGIFLRSDFLKKRRFEDKKVEDLCYGYQLSLDGIHPHLIPAFDHAATPRTLAQFLEQKRRWYQGSVYALFSSAQFKNLRTSFLWFRRFLWDVEWGMINILVTLYLFSAFSPSAAGVLLSLWILSYYSLPALVFSQRTKRMNIIHVRPSAGKIIALSVLYFFLYNIGPILGLVSYRPSKT